MRRLSYLIMPALFMGTPLLAELRNQDSTSVAFPFEIQPPGVFKNQVDIKSVTLSTSGTSLFNGSLALSGGVGHFSVKRSDIDDILQSMVVRDAFPSLLSLSVDGPSKAENLIEGLEFDPTKLGSAADILRALRGRFVEISTEEGGVSGRVSGVQDINCGESVVCTVVTIIKKNGEIEQIPLSPSMTVQPLKTEDETAIRKAIAAQADMPNIAVNQGQMKLSVESDNATQRNVGLTWIQSVTPWRTAWRAEASGDDVLLTGWAIVENTSNAPWEDITLTLSTGAVNTITPDIYDPMVPESETFNYMARGASFGVMSLEADGMAADLMSQAPPSPIMQNDQSFSRYTLPYMVTIDPGEMSLIPFISQTVKNARGLEYLGGSMEAHPDIVLNLKNPLDLRLPGGVMTFYEDSRGHAGDAVVPEIAPKDEVSLSFAKDTSVSIHESRDRTQSVQSVTFINGILKVEDSERMVTTYKAEGAADGDRMITIKHMAADGWKVQTAGAEMKDGYLRWTLSVPQSGLSSLSVVEERVLSRTLGISSVAPDQILIWAKNADSETRKRLEKISQLQNLIATEQGKSAEAGRLISSLEADQDRLLEIIRTLGSDGEAGRERVRRVGSIETQIQEYRIEVSKSSESVLALQASIKKLLQ